MLVRRELKVHKVDVEKSIDAIYLNHPFELIVIDPANGVITFTVKFDDLVVVLEFHSQVCVVRQDWTQ